MGVLDQSARHRSQHPALPPLVAGTLLTLLLLGLGATLHSMANRLIQARKRVEEANLARVELQSLLPQIEELDSLTDLYLLNRSPDTLRDARALAATIQIGAEQISDGVARQDNNVRLEACAHDLLRATDALGLPGVNFPDLARQTCGDNLLRMEEGQRVLWRGRSDEFLEHVQSLWLASFLFVLFTALATMVAFVMLARNAVFRDRALRQFSAANDRWSSALEVLDAHATEMKLLGDARDQFQMCVSAKDACDVSVHFIDQLLPRSGGALCMIDNSRQTILLQGSWGGNADVPEIFPLDACCGLRTGRERWRTPDGSVVNCGHFNAAPPSRYVCLPLVANGDTLGILYVECVGDETADLLERKVDPLRALLQLAAMTIAGLNLRARLENQSIRDSLTGLFNRHFMEITLERELRRATRKNTSLAVFMIDADNFKQFNDTFGHKAGDIVLRAIADRFFTSVRTEDIVCRYGGEEFVIILPDISVEKAVDRAESIRQAILSLRLSDNGQSLGVVTISIGVAMYPDDGDAIDQLLQAADRRLYAAKNNGRNQIMSAQQDARVLIAAR